MSAQFEKAAFNALEKYKMLEGADRVTVALSGGADSMSLLYFLNKNSEKLGITVDAAHLDHSIRGEEALRDVEFVKRECARLGVELIVKKADIPALAKERRVGLEECGRQERYAFFEQLRLERPLSVTATAHTASDNAETVLLNITRGSGTDGLCGIPPVRDGVIRPLIGCTRSDIEEYCRVNSISYITDSTNLSDNYSRNRIRLNVIPQLEMINPAAVSAINRLSQLARADKELIGEMVKSELEECCSGGGLITEKLKKLNDALLMRVIREYIIEKTSIVPEKKQIDLIIGCLSEGHGAVELRKDIFAVIERDLLICKDLSINNTTNLSIKLSMNSASLTEIPFLDGTSFDHNGKHYEILRHEPSNFPEGSKINKKLLINRISCGIISCDTVLRCRKSGDHFTQLGRGCTKSVKKLFSELKLAQQERDTRLLAANGSEVLWIEGIGVSQQAAPSNDEPFYEIKAGC